ncbi:hypothetical protein CGRA01v4_00952 [Colletotrichum graminicola]|uniref:Gastric mucin-like protein n=1 Tax=Colletotrichum graminicola (strain M1.001 / M2 / FGSC 10212) TaxID=645133 RepID=E3QGZ2_COLGM|nr:uncharacterized protein GLRG_05274 [Colletotrichum graminicola M1.001]EFQ30130.1 hypothetical protein GLRG_05274 [Colletotrichum graminicola M1.001]WDK09674.1 hypothetical protein CGRA01v4_00952 [Colletotrichum graminicola]
MTESAQYHGALVAFEGHGDLVSTQLRLLPTSTQIALLPSVKEYLEPDNPEEPFEARKFVKRVHDAVVKRREVAMVFLSGSTPRRKRLVFMNGGTPSAQTVCIKAISRNVTDGDISKAEAIFNELVKGGVESLTRHPASVGGSFLDTSDDFVEDPITRAMRAADALDRETENLQPPSDMDLTILSLRPRSLSLPMFCFADTYGDTAPFYVFGGHYHEEFGGDEGRPTETAQLRDSTPSLAVTNFDERTSAWFNRESNLTVSGPPRSPSCAGEAYERGDVSSPPSPNPSTMLGVATPRSDVFSIRSTEPIFIEQASLVRMQSSASTHTLKRSKSNGQLTRTSSRYRDTLVRLKHKNSLTEGANADNLANVRSVPGHVLVPEVPQRETKAVEIPKTVYVRSPRANSPVPSPREELAWHHRRITNRYVDRGTDAQDAEQSEDAFLPVLPFHEDLVIHFKDENPDPILEHMIKSFKEGTYPVTVSPGSSRNTSIADGRSTAPNTPPLPTNDFLTKAPTPAIAVGGGEYDPYSYDDTVLARKHPLSAPRSMTVSALPTPAHTPPPTIPEPEDKFHDFKAVKGQTAVAMQNSLRSVLNIYFPPNGRGYSQFGFPLLPEMEGLWKPIFRETDLRESLGKDSRQIDLILAVGAQRGVNKPFVSGVISQLEKLGSKPNGTCRTGRLDFRYLIANAMQSFTAQPLARQTHDNPFTNSYFLATLIVPHLETYLAAHSEVRFLLLDYPPDHLATVLALQKLVGVDMMKVAQVIDAATKEPLLFTHARGNSLGRVSPRNDFVSSSSSSVQSKDSKAAASAPSRDGLAVSKANLLLASTATEIEVATFVSTVRTLLISISKFYLPDKGSKKLGKLRTGNPSPITPQTMSPPISPLSIRSRRHIRTTSSARSSPRTSSITDNIMVRRLKSRRGGDTRPGLGDDGSIMTVDMEFESDLDLEERRLMPMFLKKNHMRKGNSRKALKFLGLA